METKNRDIFREFEVIGITTDFEDWYASMDQNVIETMDEKCIDFAKKQHAFMKCPTALFSDKCYAAAVKIVDSIDDLKLTGPLYQVSKMTVEDKEGQKVERNYIDERTFEPKFGLAYPLKTVYKLRFGVSMEEMDASKKRERN